MICSGVDRIVGEGERVAQPPAFRVQRPTRTGLRHAVDAVDEDLTLAEGTNSNRTRAFKRGRKRVNRSRAESGMMS